MKEIVRDLLNPALSISSLTPAIGRVNELILQYLCNYLDFNLIIANFAD